MPFSEVIRGESLPGVKPSDFGHEVFERPQEALGEAPEAWGSSNLDERLGIPPQEQRPIQGLDGCQPRGLEDRLDPTRETPWSQDSALDPKEERGVSKQDELGSDSSVFQGEVPAHSDLDRELSWGREFDVEQRLGPLSQENPEKGPVYRDPRPNLEDRLGVPASDRSAGLDIERRLGPPQSERNGAPEEQHGEDADVNADAPDQATHSEVQTETEKLGGSYKDVKAGSNGAQHEVHHMPADSISGLERSDGPAIRMDREDHRQTASWGNSLEARKYREAQKKLVDQGKLTEAIQMDIDDIHDKFEDKYDNAIGEMKDYLENELLKGETSV